MEVSVVIAVVIAIVIYCEKQDCDKNSGWAMTDY